MNVMASGCTTVQLSEHALGRQLPLAKSESGDDVALIAFSADQKYETKKGVPLLGDPLICSREGLFKINNRDDRTDQIVVKANEEISVTSVIQWVNTRFRKTCWPFVVFTPESGARYVVVNERIGGKGLTALWTGAAFQTCAVSVYKEGSHGFQKVPTRTPANIACTQAQQ